jgi:hypothetical protein
MMEPHNLQHQKANWDTAPTILLVLGITGTQPAG